MISRGLGQYVSPTALQDRADQPENQQHDEDDDEDVGDAHAWLPCPATCLSSSRFNRSSAYSSVRTLSALGERVQSARAISSSLYASAIWVSMTSSGSAVLATSLTSNPHEHDADANDCADRNAGGFDCGE
jgi:hypothetical protein